jgi:K+-sensing histidine kinase KdpD
MIRMLMNLIQNAVLYGVFGLEVRTWTDRKANTACVVIVDRGKRLGSQSASLDWTAADSSRPRLHTPEGCSNR